MGVPAAMLPQRVTRVRPAESTDGYGDTTYDYGAGAARTTGIPAWLQQDNRSEPRTDGREPLVQLWLMVTNEPDWTGRDQVEWTGPGGPVVFAVEGPAEPVYTPGGAHHTELTLRVVEG